MNRAHMNPHRPFANVARATRDGARGFCRLPAPPATGLGGSSRATKPGRDECYWRELRASRYGGPEATTWRNARLSTRNRKLAEFRPCRFYHRTMRSPLPSALRPATWDLGTPSSGPAMTALYTIIARVVVIVRGIAMAEIVVQVIIWRSF